MDNENQIAILRAMLDKIGINDSPFRLYIKQVTGDARKRQKQRANDHEIIRRLRIQNKKLSQQLASFKDRLKQSKADRHELTEQLNQHLLLSNSLSQALGSCPSCWGNNPDCSNCSGNGSSGWRQINRRLFNVYILPTLEVLYDLSGKMKRRKKSKH